MSVKDVLHDEPKPYTICNCKSLDIANITIQSGNTINIEAGKTLELNGSVGVDGEIIKKDLSNVVSWGSEIPFGTASESINLIPTGTPIASAIDILVATIDLTSYTPGSRVLMFYSFAINDTIDGTVVTFKDDVSTVTYDLFYQKAPRPQVTYYSGFQDVNVTGLNSVEIFCRNIAGGATTTILDINVTLIEHPAP